MVIEILSPSTAAIDRGVKLRLYARHGIPYYWIVDLTARAIEPYVLENGAYRRVRDELPPFSNLSLDLDALFA